MIALQQHPQGVVVPMRVRPGANRNAVSGVHDGALRVEVTSPPDKGKANQAVARVLSEALGVSKTSVELISGATNSRKKFLVTGIDMATADRRLRSLDAPSC
jgi:uncharacterized protein